MTDRPVTTEHLDRLLDRQTATIMERIRLSDEFTGRRFKDVNDRLDTMNGKVSRADGLSNKLHGLFEALNQRVEWLAGVVKNAEAGDSDSAKVSRADLKLILLVVCATALLTAGGVAGAIYYLPRH